MKLEIPPLNLTPEQDAAIERERAAHAALYLDAAAAKDAPSFCTYLLMALIDDAARRHGRADLDAAFADPKKRGKLIIFVNQMGQIAATGGDIKIMAAPRS